MADTEPTEHPRGPAAVAPAVPPLTEPSQVGAVFRLGLMRQRRPHLVGAERRARLKLAAAILTLDAADEHPDVRAGRRHTIAEQVAVEQAAHAYTQALADLLRGQADHE